MTSQADLLVDPLLGKKISGRFIIKAFLGSGASGRVYLADQETTGREIALKLLAAKELDAKTKERFTREAKITAKISHPNTVTVYDFGEDGEHIFLAMEHLSGQTLADKLSKGPIPVQEVIHITQQILSSLEDAHQHGIVHRDLKPANIFLAKRGAQEVVKVLDFGIAKTTEGSSGLTTEGTTYGTPAYMSPEQVCGEALDGRSDLYSLGIVVYEMLCGERPFSGNSSMEIASKHLSSPLPSLVSKREELRKISPFIKLIEQAASKKPGARFPSARAMSEAISQLFQPKEELPTKTRLLPVLALSAALLLASVIYRATQTPTSSLRVLSPGPLMVDGAESKAPATKENLVSGKLIPVESAGQRVNVEVLSGVTILIFPAEAK